MEDKHSIAIVGVGKIARDQHLPSIARSARFALAAVVSRHAKVDGVETYAEFHAFLKARPDVRAVALCTPPVGRADLALAAIRDGRHVLLEKPPAVTVGEFDMLVGEAQAHGVTLFATWHSRFATGVAPAKAWLRDQKIAAVRIVWKEDVRRWHPGQSWIWEPGGFGVFDPGINALSILTDILPAEIHVTGATLDFPQNRATPIAAHLAMRDRHGARIEAEFDWRQEGEQTWEIVVETAAAKLTLSHGGEKLSIDGAVVSARAGAEYDRIYARFAHLIDERASDADIRPLRLVADAFLLGRPMTTAPFDE